MDEAPLDARLRRADTTLGSALHAAVTCLANETDMRQWTVNRRADETYVVLAASTVDDGLATGDRIPWGDTLCSLMVDGRGPRVAGRLLETVYAPAHTPLLQAYMGAPLLDEMGVVIGSLAGTDGCTRNDLFQYSALVDTMAHHIGLLLAEATLRHDLTLALQSAQNGLESNPLTGLGNRLAWDRALRETQNRIDSLGVQAGVIIIDVDDLKGVNDRLGHSHGDKILQSVAECITAALPRPYAAARIGGDEFAVVIADVTAAQLDLLLRDLRNCLQANGASASVGGAVTSQGDVADAVHTADKAMYSTKGCTSLPG